MRPRNGSTGGIKTGAPSLAGKSMAGTCLLAMRCPGYRRRDSSLRTPDLPQGFWAGEENDLTRICRSGWLLLAALKEKLGPCRSFSCRSFRRACSPFVTVLTPVWRGLDGEVRKKNGN